MGTPFGVPIILNMQLSFENIGPKLTISGILRQLDEQQIYKKWCTEFPSHSFCSPIRSASDRDKTPSFGFFIKRGKWQWKDNATGEGGDVFDFVAAIERTDIEGAVKLIGAAFGLEGVAPVSNYSGGRIVIPDREDSKRSLIQAFHRSYSQSDLKVWTRYGITPNMLIKFKIKVAHEVWMQKPTDREPRLVWSYKPDNPIFSWTTASNHIKIYRPLEPDKRFRWLSNMDDVTDVQGFVEAAIEQTKPDLLLLVKSMKEVMFFREFGIISIAPNAEGYIVQKEFIDHLRKHSKVIISLYDSDLAGVKGMKRLKKEYGIPGIVIPRAWGGPERKGKDPTDLWMYDYKRVYDLLNLIDEYYRAIREHSGMDAYSFGFRYTGKAA
jgi:hypothetical protein